MAQDFSVWFVVQWIENFLWVYVGCERPMTKLTTTLQNYSCGEIPGYNPSLVSSRWSLIPLRRMKTLWLICSATVATNLAIPFPLSEGMTTPLNKASSLIISLQITARIACNSQALGYLPDQRHCKEVTIGCFPLNPLTLKVPAHSQSSWEIPYWWEDRALKPHQPYPRSSVLQPPTGYLKPHSLRGFSSPLPDHTVLSPISFSWMEHSEY